MTTIRVGLLIALAVGFVLAHTQSPPYYSNQNQYWLHGFALANQGDLAHDWLAKTRDPTPAFSQMVSQIVRFGGPVALQVAFAILLLVYAASALWILQRFSRHWLAAASLFLALHAAIIRVWSADWLGVDYPWFFQAGVANQYILGPGLQPSAFGVLLFASMAAFANGRPFLASFCAALGATIHATYLLPAALLTTGFCIKLFSDGFRQRAFLVGAIALAVVTPTLVFVLQSFAPSDAFTHARAQEILVNIRIPHHAKIVYWLDAVAIAQIAWAGLGIVLLKNNLLFVPLVWSSGVAFMIGLAQWLTGNDSLALVFPWRISAVLVPMATLAFCARIADWLPKPFNILFAGMFACTIVGGVWVGVKGIGYPMSAKELPLLDFVKNNRKPGDVYLLPMRMPDLQNARRGAAALTFAKRENPIPGDLQRFRLITGAAIYIDFKSIPYADFEVLDWYDRVRNCDRWFEAANWSEVLIPLRQCGISHVVTTADRPIHAAGFEEVFGDQAYRLYRVNWPKEGG